MAGPADALQERGDRTRRPQLAHQVDMADVDAQFQRGGRHHRLQAPLLQPLLGALPAAMRQAAVMRQDLILAQPLASTDG